MSGYAVSGFCYPDLAAAAVRIASEITLSEAVVQGSPTTGNDGVSDYVSVPVSVIQGGVLTPISPLVFRPLSCSAPGPLAYMEFDPATLNPVQITAAFAAGFGSVSVPIIVAVMVSTVLNFIRGKRS
jgi:hypothetical protein